MHLTIFFLLLLLLLSFIFLFFFLLLSFLSISFFSLLPFLSFSNYFFFKPLQIGAMILKCDGRLYHKDVDSHIYLCQNDKVNRKTKFIKNCESPTCKF